MKYKISIYDEFLKLELSGIFSGNKTKAIRECRNFYARELDCTPRDIKIISIQALGGD